jgi:hypothetical protein
VLGPRSVFLHGLANFVSLFNTIDGCVSDTVSWDIGRGKERTTGVNLSEEIVPVEVTSKFVNSIPSVIAELRVIMDLQVIEVIVAIVCLESVQKLFRDQVEVENNFGESRADIEIPVSSTVSYHDTLEGVLGLSTVGPLSLEIVLVKLPSEVRYINSSIAFSTDVKIVLN